MLTIFLTLFFTSVYSRTLRVCTKPAPPFSIVDNANPIGWNGFSWDYFENELMPILRERTNVRDFTILDCTDNTESLRQASIGTVDLAHAAITKTSVREEIVDFTNTWFVSGFRVLVRSQDDLFQTLGRIIGTLGTAIGLFIAVLAVLTLGGSMLLSVAEMSSPGPIDPWDTTSYMSSLFGASAVIQGTLLPGSGSIIEPYGFYSKIVLSGFKSFGAVLPPILTALITMVLVINNSANVIQGVNDLQGKSVIVPRGTTSEMYLRTYQSGVQRILVSDVDTMFRDFAAGKGDAIIYDWPVLESFRHSMKESGSTVKYEIVGDVFEQQQYGIAVSPNVPNHTELKEALNHAILQTWETDRFNLLEQKWIHNDNSAEGITLQSANNQLIALLLTGSFVLAFGILVTIIWFLFRCCSSGSMDSKVQSRSIRSLGNEIKETVERQEKYAKRLPPNTLTYANWELLASIANFLKEWKPVKATAPTPPIPSEHSV